MANLRHRVGAEARGANAGRSGAEARRPVQSELSKRWIAECLERGKPAKMEAISAVLYEAEGRKDVSASLPPLGRLTKDPDEEVAGGAAVALGICARECRAAMSAAPGIVALLSSPSDVVVEAAIASLTECMKDPSHLSRKSIATRLSHLMKDGAPAGAKANAGYALAQMFHELDFAMEDKELRRAGMGAFTRLLSSKDYHCVLAGITGIANMALAAARRRGEIRGVAPEQYFGRLAPAILMEGEPALVAMDAAALCGSYGADLTELVFPLLVKTMSAGEGEGELLARGEEAIREAVRGARTRIPALELITSVMLSAQSALRDPGIDVETRALIGRKRGMLEGLIRYGAMVTEMEGRVLCIRLPDGNGAP